MRRDAEGLLERSREVRLGDAAHAGQPRDGPLLVRGGVHPVLRAQQAAQQLGVLTDQRGQSRLVGVRFVEFEESSRPSLSHSTSLTP